MEVIERDMSRTAVLSYQLSQSHGHATVSHDHVCCSVGRDRDELFERWAVLHELVEQETSDVIPSRTVAHIKKQWRLCDFILETEACETRGKVLISNQ